MWPFQNTTSQWLPWDPQFCSIEWATLVFCSRERRSFCCTLWLPVLPPNPSRVFGSLVLSSWKDSENNFFQTELVPEVGKMSWKTASYPATHLHTLPTAPFLCERYCLWNTTFEHSHFLQPKMGSGGGFLRNEWSCFYRGGRSRGHRTIAALAWISPLKLFISATCCSF